jgi:hypothetical protein
MASTITYGSVDPFGDPPDGRALLICNGVVVGPMTFEEFEDWDHAQEMQWESGDQLVERPGLDLSLGLELPESVEQPDLSIAYLASHCRRLADGQDKLVALLAVFASRMTDPTHVSVEEAARIEGVSSKTIRNRISSGRYSLQQVPGTRRTGIPTDQLFNRWVSISTARGVLRLVNDEA